MKHQVIIRPLTNGPYVVEGLEHLENSKGDRLTAKGTIALCRCGGSKNKPFCDGTHARKGFVSKNTRDESKNKNVDYAGGGLTIHDNRGICAHAGFCTEGLPAVFNNERTPWIDPHGAPPDAIAGVIRQCPSGALRYTSAAVEHRDHPPAPAIVVSKDGPYYVRGGPALEDAPWGEGASREHYTLCRCGESENKPFCDGTHWSVGFTDDQN